MGTFNATCCGLGFRRDVARGVLYTFRGIAFHQVVGGVVVAVRSLGLCCMSVVCFSSLVFVHIKPSNSKVCCVHCCRYSGGDFCGPSRSKGLGGWSERLGLSGAGAVQRLYSPKSAVACCNPFDHFFFGLVAAWGGQVLSGGIQFVTEVVMMPLFPQRTMRWSLSGGRASLGGRLGGIMGGRRGVVIRRVLGGWSGGFSLGRTS